MPEELRGCCALALDISSAGCFGQVNKACKEVVAVRLAGEKAARDRAVLEKVSSRWCEALAPTWRVVDGPSLISFSDGGAKIYNCSCTPGRELRVGFAYFNLADALCVAQALEALAPCRPWRGAADGGCVAGLCSLKPTLFAPRRAPRVGMTRVTVYRMLSSML